MYQHVDPFIGTDGPGSCLPGPYLPLGLVRLSPDTAPPQPTNGYSFRSPIARFSHTHVSGTGGMSRYGNIGVTPFIGHPRLAVEPFPAHEEEAACGYYGVTAGNSGIRCELTATARVGVHRYRFPSGSTAQLLIDLGAVIQCEFSGFKWDPNGWPARSTGGFVEFVSDRAVVGRADLQGGWGHDHPYSVYFYAETDRPFRTKRIGQHGSTPCTISLWWFTVMKDGQYGRSVIGCDRASAAQSNLPVAGISYSECQTFLKSLNSKVPGLNAAMPTEAQWEYACRAGTTGPYAGDLNAEAWMAENSGNKFHPVKTKAPNPWGLYDMPGNVYTWCQDTFANFTADAVTDPLVITGTDRVIRGGSYYYHKGYLRSASRWGVDPNKTDCPYIGFRICVPTTSQSAGK